MTRTSNYVRCRVLRDPLNAVRRRRITLVVRFFAVAQRPARIRRPFVRRGSKTLTHWPLTTFEVMSSTINWQHHGITTYGDPHIYRVAIDTEFQARIDNEGD